MTWKKKSLLIAVLLFGTITLSGCIFKDAPTETYQVDLEVWGVFDDSDAYTEAFNEYRKINPYIKEIRYRKFSIDTYKEDLLNALAAGKGPDLFMIRNSWRRPFEDKIAPAPDALVTEKEFRDSFVDVASADFIGQDKKIYGAPLTVDSLALYYNKDLLNAAGISQPPKTWEELLQAVSKLNQVDQLGNITQSGIALGTAMNINRSTDILNLIMLQVGVPLGEKGQEGRIDLNNEQAQRAVDFYSQFARIGSPYYSWNPRQHYSIDAFYEGTLGMMINYSWQYETIKQKNAKLNIGVVPLPQFTGSQPMNVANYWGYAVAKNKPYVTPPGAPVVAVDQEKHNYLRTHEAWQLLKYLSFGTENGKITLMNGISGTTKEFTVPNDPTETYLKKTKKPAARRDLVEKQKNDVVFGSFSLGNLIAQSWYQGNPEAVEAIFADMIESINRGEKSVYEALSSTTQRINLVERK